MLSTLHLLDALKLPCDQRDRFITGESLKLHLRDALKLHCDQYFDRMNRFAMVASARCTSTTGSAPEGYTPTLFTAWSTRQDWPPQAGQTPAPAARFPERSGQPGFPVCPSHSPPSREESAQFPAASSPRPRSRLAAPPQESASYGNFSSTLRRCSSSLPRWPWRRRWTW